MAEQIDLTAPLDPDPRLISSLQVSRLDLNWEGEELNIILYDSATGWRGNYPYTGQEAVDMMTALNKVNLSNRSLKQRIFDRLIADGRLAGTVGGTVD
jgi:hypothetical protein